MNSVSCHVRAITPCDDKSRGLPVPFLCISLCAMTFITAPRLWVRKGHPSQAKRCGYHPMACTATPAENPRSVIVISSINADSTYSLDTLPLRGETVLSKSLAQTLGGKGANTAVAAAKAGASTYFVGAVGSGDTFLSKLSDYGVNVSHCVRDDSVETGHAIILLDASGDNSIVVHPGANAVITATALNSLQQILPRSVVALHLEIPHDVVQDVAIRAHDAGAIVVLNPSPVPRKGSPLHDPDAPLWQNVDVLIVNAIELGLMAGSPTPSFDDVPSGEPLSARHVQSLVRVLSDFRRKLSIRRSAAIVVTLGSHGVIYQDPSDGHDSTENATLHRVPALANIDVVDSTGAGDCLTGYISACMASGLDLESTVRHGVTAAGLCVTKSGTAKAVPEMSEVRKRLSALM